MLVPCLFGRRRLQNDPWKTHAPLAFDASVDRQQFLRQKGAAGGRDGRVDEFGAACDRVSSGHGRQVCGRRGEIAWKTKGSRRFSKERLEGAVLFRAEKPLETPSEEVGEGNPAPKRADEGAAVGGGTGRPRGGSFKFGGGNATAGAGFGGGGNGEGGRRAEVGSAVVGRATASLNWLRRKKGSKGTLEAVPEVGELFAEAGQGGDVAGGVGGSGEEEGKEEEELDGQGENDKVHLLL